MLYSVRLAGGKFAYVYLLFEHESIPARFVVLQLLRCMLEIWELHRKQNKGAKTLPLVLPVIVCHGKTRRQAVGLLELTR